MTGRMRAPAGATAALLAWASAIGAVACNNNASGNAGPQIESITPSQGRPGDRVSIAGDNFGSDSASASVTFGDVAAQIASIRNRTLAAIVPAAVAGSVDVAVDVDGRSSNAQTFTVLPALPAITLLSPASVRAGDLLTVQGHGLSGGTVTVTADSLQLTASVVTDSLLTVPIPLGLPPGSYSIRVTRDGDESNRVTEAVEIFTATGSYAVHGTVLFNNCPGGPAVGSTVTTTASVIDTRPTLSIVIPEAGAEPMQGILQTGGSFTASQEALSNISGSFGATQEGLAGFDARLEIQTATSSCHTTEDVVGTRP